jgi:hypothetical protein
MRHPMRILPVLMLAAVGVANAQSYPPSAGIKGE